MQTVEFADIRIRAALPLHPYLSKHPRLLLRLVADGSVCGDTAGVDGDLATGVWEFNARLYAPRVKQSLNIGVLTGAKGPGIQIVSVTIKVAELLAREKACPNRHKYVVIFDSRAAIQFKLIVTCSIKLSLDRVPQDDKGHTIDRHSRNNESNLDLTKTNPSSREDLETAYKMTARTPDGDESKARTLSKLGHAYHTLYDKEHRKENLEKAISVHEEAMQRTGLFHPHLAEHAHRFAMALSARFNQSGDRIDIERAISYCHAALRFTEDLDAAKPSRLSNLGNALQLRFVALVTLSTWRIRYSANERPSGGVEDLNDAISNLRQAVQLTPEGHPGRPSQFNNFGLALQSRFERLGVLADLGDAISNLQQAVKLTPDGHPDNLIRFNNLGLVLQSRFERLGVLADLEDAIPNLQQAVQLTPDGHPNKPNRFSNLGTALRSRFECLGGVADLEDAISNLQQAVRLTPDSHPSKPSRFNNLGLVLQSRFERLGGLADLEDAISNLRQAVELTPDGHPDNIIRFYNLEVTLRSRFKRLGVLADLEDAISNLQQAVPLMPDNHPEKSSLFSKLGLALRSRFERLGGLADLEDAISNLWQAVQLMSDGHPDKPSGLDNLGLGLRSRFERLGGLADLEGAVSNLREAVQLTPDSHPDKPRGFNNLGIALRSRFERLGVLADLGDAISNLRQAVELTPDGHPDKIFRFYNLGVTLQSRFERLGFPADLEDAISNLQQAVRPMPDDHPETLNVFISLGLSLRSRFERLGGLADLEDALSNLQQAVQLTPDGYHDMPFRLYHLGLALASRFRRLGIPGDLESALSTLSTAANSRIGSAMVCFNAAHAWAKLAEEQSRPPLDAFQCAIDLLPRIAWLGLAVTDQHALLAYAGGIVRDAVAAAIRYEEYETAVVWAEQGRSIVWQNLLGLRSPVDDLRETRPELADRVCNIAKQLDGPGFRLEVPTASAGDVSLDYSKSAIEWDNIVEEVRRIPGFEGFLKAKSFRQLAPAAHEGPVVILNVNDAQCDALVLIADGSNDKQVSVVNIPLKRFSDETSKNLFHSLTSLLTGAGVRVREARLLKPRSHPDGEAKFKDILRVLWQDIVKPVLEGLAFQARLFYHAPNQEDLLVFGDIGDRISDYVISSYTPTLNAILELSDPVAHEDFQVLTVAQASAPGAQSIPDKEGEVRIVQRLTDGARRVNLMREDATVERVREEMTESNWIHLSCHGQQNPEDPMESGFLLHDKILKLSEVVKMSLPKADFAFLSACQTAMGDEKIAEESVHLAAGMLLSGCRGVIATTWSIRDEDGPKIAEDVYSRIFKDGKPNRKEAAYALHEAVKLLRESGAQYTSWVPFIHIGR